MTALVDRKCEVVYAPPIARPYNSFRDESTLWALPRSGPPWTVAVTGRAHRIRTVREWRDGSRTPSIDHWCGTSAIHAVAVDRIDSEANVCGTCEGRAIGAGMPSSRQLIDEPSAYGPLVFSPRSVDVPPRWCPGSGLDLGDADQHLCLVCGARVKWRASGGPWRSNWGMERHDHEVLIRPCIWHGWKSLCLTVDARRPVGIRCACGTVLSGQR